jgi:hypothetical protein
MKKNIMKKGIQYSHYCGTELMEIISGVHLCMEWIEEDKDEAINWGKYVKKMAEQLRDKIAELDKINEMNY